MLTGAAFRHFWGIPPQKKQLVAWQPTADSVAFLSSLFRYFPATTATRAPLLSPVFPTSSPVSFSFPSLPPCVCYGVYHTAFVLFKASVSAKFACCVAVGIWVGAVGGAEGLPSGKPFRCRRSAVEPAPGHTRTTVSSTPNSHLTCVLKYQTFITFNKSFTSTSVPTHFSRPGLRGVFSTRQTNARVCFRG